MLTRLFITRRISGLLGKTNDAIASNSRAMSTNALSAEFLLSEEHKNRVLECMKKASPIGLKPSKGTAAKAYAAVLIGLCTKKPELGTEQEVSILYTRRSARLSRHVRQVSFPGGLQDHSDTDCIDCALRETEEEIGLPRSRIEIWGIGKMIEPPNTAAIMPVVGVIRDFDMSELKLNEDEVEDAFTVSIKDFIDPNVVRHTQFKSGFSSVLFMVKPYRIWGITGFLTNSFLQCLLPRDVYRNRLKFIKPYKIDKTVKTVLR